MFAKLADNSTHLAVGLRTNGLRDETMVQNVFGAKIQHENEFLCVMNFRRRASPPVSFEETRDCRQTGDRWRGIDHVCCGLASFGDLVAVYERLKSKRHPPFYSLNPYLPWSL